MTPPLAAFRSTNHRHIQTPTPSVLHHLHILGGLGGDYKISEWAVSDDPLLENTLISPKDAVPGKLH